MLSRFGFAALKQTRATMVRQPVMICATQRMTYLKDLGLDSDAIAIRQNEKDTSKSGGAVELWKA